MGRKSIFYISLTAQFKTSFCSKPLLFLHTAAFCHQSATCHVFYSLTNLQESEEPQSCWLIFTYERVEGEQLIGVVHTNNVFDPLLTEEGCENKVGYLCMYVTHHGDKVM